MRTLKVLCALIITFLVVAVIIDGKLYYYGRNIWCIHDELPLKIIPQYWGYERGHLGFVLLDEYDMTVVASGSKYWSSDIEIRQILKYGFNKDKLVVLVVDTFGRERYVLLMKNDNKISKQYLEITVFSNVNFLNDRNIKWVDVKKPTKRLELVRNYLIVFSIILLFIIMYRIVRKCRIKP